MSKKISCDALYADVLAAQEDYRGRLPPVKNWAPPLSGNINIKITRDGTWYHEGTAITRASLVKLFSSILKRENDSYFLVTPQEKWGLLVEDAPLYVVAMRRELRDGHQALIFTTKTEDTVLLSADHPLRIEVDPDTGEPAPYVLVRDRLEGLISRAVYYELAELSEERVVANNIVYGVTSMGSFFPLS
jgi:uncharacterized protein